MATSESQPKEIAILRDRIRAARGTVEQSPADVVYAEDILSTLSQLETALGSDPVDPHEVRRGAFGVFRLVTDSRVLKESSLGDELMAICSEANKLARSTDNTGS
jgi:hypothetical protein